MARFNDMKITSAGKSIFAKAIAGKAIEFTKAVLGSGGAKTGADIESMTNVITPVIEESVKIEENSDKRCATIIVTVDNSSLSSDVAISEIGLFCKDPDTQEEVMYSYANAPDTSDIIPAASNGEITWEMQLLVYIDN